MKIRCWSSLLITTIFLTMPIQAADWPQWRGPDRDGVSKETGLLQSWPKGGPQLLWTFENAGIGFSCPSIVGDRLYTMGTRNGVAEIFCLDVNTSKEIWSTKIGPTFDGNILWGGGPRSTPTVDGEYVYGLTGNGVLACVKAKDGELVWKVDFQKDFGGEMMTEWGYSESVLIDGDKLICAPGSTKKGTFAALNKKTGEVLWFSSELKDKASYSSLMPAEIGGVKQYIGLSYSDDLDSAAVASIAAKDGKLIWYFPLDSGAIDTAAPTPIIKGDQVYVTVGFSTGAFLLEITKEGEKFKVENLYSSSARRSLKNTHGGVVNIGDYIYGHSESLGWVCQKWDTGRKIWYERFKLQCNASGSICAAEGNLYLYSDYGEAVLLKATPEGWQEQGRFAIPKKSVPPPNSRARKIWTHPVIANGRLYLRDQEYIFCYDIRAKK